VRLLVITDEPGNTGFIKDGLEKASFAVDIACGGRCGLALALTNDYALIILDRMIPVISAVEFCRQMHQTGSAVPILFLAPGNTPEDDGFDLKDGASDYITKPFAFAELLARIRVLLRHKTRNDDKNKYRWQRLALHRAEQ